MDKILAENELNLIIKNVYAKSLENIAASNKNLSIKEMLKKVQANVNDEIRKRSNGECTIGDLRIGNLRIDDVQITTSNINSKKLSDNIELEDCKNKSNSESNSECDSQGKTEEESDSELDGYVEDFEDEYKITFKKFLQDVECIDDLKSMFIGMILDLKERMKGCEQCETCSEVICIVENYIKEYKKISKLAVQLANLFMPLVDKRIPKPLNNSQKKILDLVFIMIIKNSKFIDVEYIYECFKDNININAFDGLGMRLSIQKHGNNNIKKLISWGADITVREHRPIVRAFHYEDFHIVKTLIKQGSSYKYYLKAELEDDEFEFVYQKVQDLLHKELPNGSDKDKEYKFIEWMKEYIVIQNKLTNKTEQVAEIEFIYDFIEHLHINLEDIHHKTTKTTKTTKTNIIQSETNPSNGKDSNGKDNKDKKRKKKKKNKSQIQEPIQDSEQINICLPTTDKVNNIAVDNIAVDNIAVDSNNSEYDDVNDETFGEDIKFGEELLDIEHNNIEHNNIEHNNIEHSKIELEHSKNLYDYESDYFYKHFNKVFEQYTNYKSKIFY